MRYFINFSLLFAATANALPHYATTLAGFSAEEVAHAMRSWPSTPGAQPIPPPISDTSTKLINDAAHPYIAPGPGDARGPCPGLNALANHGYLNRTGIASPGEIITAVQEGFNMGYTLAIFSVYSAFIVDGNMLTNLMSIGGKSPSTGPDPPLPATVGGLNTHGVWEGDASLTRSDDAIGDNHNFNETLFQQFVTAADEFGNGTINLASSAEHRYNRIIDSIANNPSFDLTSPRASSVYGEAVFPLRLLANGSIANSDEPYLTIEHARSLFELGKLPENWYRREGPLEDLSKDVQVLYTTHPTRPGKNQGAGNFVVDSNDPGLVGKGSQCFGYKKQVNEIVPSLYPNPEGPLLEAMKVNLEIFYNSVAMSDPTCEQQFPYGK